MEQNSVYSLVFMYFLYKLSIICIYYMCDGRYFFLSTSTEFSWYPFFV